MQRGADRTWRPCHCVSLHCVYRRGETSGHIVPEPESQIATSSAEADLPMYRSRADEIFAARQWFNTLCTAYVTSQGRRSARIK